MNKVFNILYILIKYISIFQMSRNSFVFCLSRWLQLCLDHIAEG